MKLFKSLMTVVPTLAIAGTVVLSATSAEACLFNKFKSGSGSTNSASLVSPELKNFLTSKSGAILGGMTAATGVAGVAGLGLLYRSRRVAQQDATTTSQSNLITDKVDQHPEAPGGELDLKEETVLTK